MAEQYFRPNIHIYTYIYSYMYIYICIYIYIYVKRERNWREHDCIKGGSVWGNYGETRERKRMLKNEKYWNISSVYEDNITQCM
jgi:hypothetical protein